MTAEQIETIVLAQVREAFRLQGEAGKEVTLETPIYGPTSDLDSLGFIAAIIGVEDELHRGGVEVSLAPDGTFDPAERYATVAAMRDFLAGA
jgi:acyl carrier protein